MAKPAFPALRDIVQFLTPDAGKPRVQDDDGVRCLRFDGGVLQSTMRLAEPYALDLSYTKTMMGFMLFNTEPRHILLVGLGGGSLSKYCYRRFPEARITTLEIDPEVIALRGEFQIPPDDERFRVVQADARDWLASADAQADVILLDAYDAAGLPHDLCAEPFYSNCWRALDDQGVLAANYWGGEPDRGVYLERLRAIFDGRVWWSRAAGSDNLIAFAVKNPHFYPQWSRLMSRAQALDRRYALGLAKVVNDMRERPDPDA